MDKLELYNMSLAQFKIELISYLDQCKDYVVEVHIEDEDGQYVKCRQLRFEQSPNGRVVELQCSPNDCVCGYMEYTLGQMFEEIKDMLNDMFISSADFNISTTDGSGCDWWIDNPYIKLVPDHGMKVFYIKGSNE